MAVLNAIIWGITPYIIKPALARIPFQAFLFYRFLQVVLILFVLNPVKFLKSLFTKKLPKPLYLSGILFNFVTLYFFFWGLTYVSPTVGAVLAAIGPIFLVFWGIFVNKDKIERQEFIGLLFVLIGYGFLIFDNSVIQFDWRGVVLLLLGNVAFIIATIINKRYIDEKSESVYELWSYVLAAILFGVINFFKHPDYINVFKHFAEFLSFEVLFTSIGASLAAVWAYNRALMYLEISEVSIFAYLQPFFGVLYYWFVTGASIGFATLVGLAIMLIGTIVNFLGVRHERKYD